MRFLLPGDLKKNYIGYPNTVAVVAAWTGNRRANFMSVVWQTQLSMSPLLQGVSISPKRYTHRVIRDAGVFSVAFYPFERKAVYVVGGRMSGRDDDKARVAGVRVRPGKALDVPLIDGFYAAFECELHDVITLGDHDLFVGLVKGIHLDEAAFATDGITPLDTRPTMYLGANRYVTMDKDTLEVLDLDSVKRL